MVEASAEIARTAPELARDSEPAATRPSAPPIRCNVRALKKSFGKTEILKGIHLEIPEGTFAVLVGPSGCGKSTLLRMLAGLEQPDSGTIHLAGEEVTYLPPRDRDIAMVFQSYALYPHLTVRENLAFGLKLRRVESAEVDKRIREASKLLGLDALLDRLPRQLSGGQRQRVAMGRAIVRRPRVFLFDEPLSNLDAALRAEVRVEIRKLHDRLGATTVYVTHDQVEAMTLADKLWILNGGNVEQTGAPLDVYDRPRSKFVATFLGSPQMNMLSGKLSMREGRWRAIADTLELPVDAERYAGALEDGLAVDVGVRPHHLRAGLSDRAAPREGVKVGQMRVEFVEALGNEAFAYGWAKAAGERIVVHLDADLARSCSAGDRLELHASAHDVHLFDAKSGAALDARSA